MGAKGRLRQFFTAISAHLIPEERAELVDFISPGELWLFERMPRFDQRHCLDVYYTLRRHGYHDPVLLRAALLHDCGKVDNDGRSIPLIYYGIFVILQTFAPALYRWAARIGRGPLRPFALHAIHEHRSVLLLEAIGCDPAVTAILRDYAEGRATPQTQALRWADDQN